MSPEHEGAPAETEAPSRLEIGAAEATPRPAWLVTAAYSEWRAGRRRYVVVLARGRAARHIESPSLAEAQRTVASHPHALRFVNRLENTP